VWTLRDVPARLVNEVKLYVWDEQQAAGRQMAHICKLNINQSMLLSCSFPQTSRCAHMSQRLTGCCTDKCFTPVEFENISAAVVASRVSLPMHGHVFISVILQIRAPAFPSRRTASLPVPHIEPYNVPPAH